VQIAKAHIPDLYGKLGNNLGFSYNQEKAHMFMQPVLANHAELEVAEFREFGCHFLSIRDQPVKNLQPRFVGKIAD
jgi:hypothetical protein